jgi:hypothetical protein
MRLMLDGGTRAACVCTSWLPFGTSVHTSNEQMERRINEGFLRALAQARRHAGTNDVVTKPWSQND